MAQKLVGCLWAALLWAGMSYGAPVEDTLTTDGPGGVEVATSDSRVDEIPEIIVTAEKRSESLQKASISITVVSDEEMKRAGLYSTRDITRLDPGVQIGQGGPATQTYIRGVGDYSAIPTGNPAVAVYVDGVYVARTQSIEGNFFDLQRVEILKGPQGTLYGRNATGGAINLITKKPEIGAFTGNGTVEVGNFGEVTSEGGVTLPLAPKVALRAAFQTVKHDGYESQGFDDADQQSGRLQMLWTPGTELSLLLKGEYTHVGGNGPGYVFKGPLDPAVAAALGAAGLPSTAGGVRASLTDPSVANIYYGLGALGGLCVPNGFLSSALGAANGPVHLSGPQGFCGAGKTSLLAPPDAASMFEDNRFWDVSAELNADLGWSTLTALLADRNVRNDYTTFPLITYTNSSGGPEHSDSKSAEVRLSNQSDLLRWVAGAYYFKEKQSYHTGGAPQNWLLLSDREENVNADTLTDAIFGEVNYSVIPDARVILGARYSHDRREQNGQTTEVPSSTTFDYTAGGPCFTQVGVCLLDHVNDARVFNSVTWKVGTEYDLRPQSMLYATLSTGEKAGGFDHNSGAVVGHGTAYEPEKLTALELGSRNRFFERRLQVNLEAFLWKYRDAQETTVTVNSLGTVILPTVNAGRATLYGTDLDVVFQPTSANILHVGMEYLHARFDSFKYDTVFESSLTTGCRIVSLGGPAQQLDCSGKPMIRAPEYSGVASYTHVFPLANGGTIDAVVSSTFAAARWLGVDYIAADRASSYVVGDASLAYESPSRHWSVTGFVRNFNNAVVYTGSFSNVFLPSMVASNIGPPRTYGVRLSASF